MELTKKLIDCAGEEAQHISRGQLLHKRKATILRQQYHVRRNISFSMRTQRYRPSLPSPPLERHMTDTAPREGMREMRRPIMTTYAVDSCRWWHTIMTVRLSASPSLVRFPGLSELGGNSRTIRVAFTLTVLDIQRPSSK